MSYTSTSSPAQQRQVSALPSRLALVLAAALIAAFAPATDASDVYSGDGTFYGNNGWAGSCAGQVGGAYGAPGVWPPAGSYINSMQPGSAVPINVALNRPQYSTSMCGKLLYVRATAASAACKTCGMTPISTEYILARVTNECPECAPGSLDLGIQGDGRWKIEWHWADSGTNTQSVGAAVRAKTVMFQKKPSYKKKTPARHKKSSHHTARYYVLLKAAAIRRAAVRMAIKRKAAARHYFSRKHGHGRKLFAATLTMQQLPAAISK